MNFNKLYYFQQIARHENIRKASESLYISQSALSKALRELESELGCELFERKGRRLILNDAGSYLLYMTESILRQVNEIKPKMTEFSNRTKSFTISSSHSCLIDWIYCALKEAYPGMRLICHNGMDSYETKLQMLTEHKLDLLTLSLTDSEYQSIEPFLARNNLYCLPFARDRIYISAPRTPQYLSKETCRLSDLKQMPLVKCGPDYWVTEELERFFLNKDESFRWSHLMNSHSFLNIWEQIDYPFVTDWFYMNNKEFCKGFKMRHQILLDEPEADWGIYLFYRTGDRSRMNKLLPQDPTDFYSIFFPMEEEDFDA